MYARSFLIMLLGFLGGCSIQSAMIRHGALSYDDIIEDTTDKFLLLNILRAKDKAPLHFDDIPLIHESIQATASVQATWPFGPRTPTANARNTVTPGLSLQVTPTFDVAHLDTKDFVTGLASPIDPKFVKYWLDRGLDRRIVMLLFFSSATISETALVGGQKTVTTIRLMNSPRAAIETLEQQAVTVQEGAVAEELRCDAVSDFQHYLKFIDSLDQLSARYYKEPRLLTTIPSQSANLKDLLGVDPEKYYVAPNKDNSQLEIYVIPASAKTTLCPTDRSSGTRTCIELQVETVAVASTASEQTPLTAPAIQKARQPSDYCKLFNGVVAGNGLQDASNRDATISVRLEMRSVGEMIQFLGDLLEYQETLAAILAKAPQFRLNEPLTFGYCPDKPSAGCGDVFFNLQSNTCNTRFAVEYRGRVYGVPNYTPAVDQSCDSAGSLVRGTRGADHTLEVLSVVHQMVDLQKSAQDIRETPYVQVLP